MATDKMLKTAAERLVNASAWVRGPSSSTLGVAARHAATETR